MSIVIPRSRSAFNLSRTQAYLKEPLPIYQTMHNSLHNLFTRNSTHQVGVYVLIRYSYSHEKLLVFTTASESNLYQNGIHCKWGDAMPSWCWKSCHYRYAQSQLTITISLVFDQMWSQSIINDLITIRSWLRQALITTHYTNIINQFISGCRVPSWANDVYTVTEFIWLPPQFVFCK